MIQGGVQRSARQLFFIRLSEIQVVGDGSENWCCSVPFLAWCWWRVFSYGYTGFGLRSTNEAWCNFYERYWKTGFKKLNTRLPPHFVEVQMFGVGGESTVNQRPCHWDEDENEDPFFRRLHNSALSIDWGMARRNDVGGCPSSRL